MRRLIRLLHLLPWLLSVWSAPVAAQDLSAYNRALTLFNAGELDAAARSFFELYGSATDAEVRAKAEYYLAQSFARKGLPLTAFVWYASILREGSKHPYYLKAVEGLVNVQARVNDQFLIPNLLNNSYSEGWATLPLETLSRINLLIGAISQRRGRYDEATAFLEAVPEESAAYASAQYLLGTVLVDPRLPGGPKPRRAAEAFERVLAQAPPSTAGAAEHERIRQLALLGLGRVLYGLGEYQRATEAYERVPRFSRYWDEALFENGFARFQNDDFGGALGSLQALHAPQFAGAFQPESWILKSTVYYFSCLYDAASTALGAYDELYQPMAAALKALLEDPKADLFELVHQPQSPRVPRPVLNWVRSNERLAGVFELLTRLDQEQAALRETVAWQGSAIVADNVSYLDENRATLRRIASQLAKNRLAEAAQNLRTFSDQADIIRFEIAKARRELAEAGIDQAKLLAAQPLYHPKIPNERWSYWKFQGEFWIDEIGYYQYTLKRGCPDVAEQPER